MKQLDQMDEIRSACQRANLEPVDVEPDDDHPERLGCIPSFELMGLEVSRRQEMVRLYIEEATGKLVVSIRVPDHKKAKPQFGLTSTEIDPALFAPMKRKTPGAVLEAFGFDAILNKLKGALEPLGITLPRKATHIGGSLWTASVGLDES
jgi:hypothetical protein